MSTISQVWFQITFHIMLLFTLQDMGYSFHFTDGESEAQRNFVRLENSKIGMS